MFTPTSGTAIRLVQELQERSRGESSALEGVVVVVVAEFCRQQASGEALVAVPSCALGTSPPS